MNACLSFQLTLQIILIALNVQLFQASDRLGELIQMVDRCEPRNSFLYHDLSQAFSRLVCIKIICSGQVQTDYEYQPSGLQIALVFEVTC